MKNYLKTALVALALVTLTACGGGGGGGDAPAGGNPPVVVTPPVGGGTPTVSTFSCWNGAITSTTATLTKSDCSPATTPVVTLGSNNYPTVTFAVGAIPTSGMVTATAGISTVVYGVSGGVVSLVSGTVSHSTQYQHTARAVYTNAPDSMWSGTFTTGADPVLALLANAKATITPQGVQKVVPLANSAVADDVNLVTDPRFLQAIADGRVLAIDVGDLMSNSSTTSYRARPLVVFIYYWQGFARIKHAFKDDFTGSVSNSLHDSLFGFKFDRAMGASNGLLIRATSPEGAIQCSIMGWDTQAFGFGGNASTACPVWN